MLAARKSGYFELRHAPIGRDEADKEPDAPPHVASLLAEGGVYLITGGLGGLGLTLAEHLARRHRAKLVLLGRSVLPPRADWARWLEEHGASDRTSRRLLALESIERAGGAVQIAAADVTDADEVRAALLEARKRFGPVHGVFHAAGVVRDSLMAMKSQGEVEDVFTPKVHGTQVLDLALAEVQADAPPKFFLLYSSTSTAIAPAGQADYVAANEFLNAFARSKPRSSNTIAVNWGIWSEVGLAAESLAAGSLTAGARRSERPAEAEAAAGAAHAARYPLFDYWTRSGELLHFHGRLSARTHWLLDEHRTADGSALLPGTGYLELARAALAECGESSTFEACDLLFFRPFYVGDLEERRFRVVLRRDAEGYGFEVQSHRTLTDGRAGWWMHAQARLLLHALTPAENLSLASIDDRCTLRRTPLDPNGIRSRQEDHIRFGRRWRVLHQSFYGAAEAVGRLALRAEHHEDLADFALHPALLDIATGYGLELIRGYAEGNALWVPVAYRHARYRAPLTPEVRSWIKNHGDNRADGEFASFDVVITDLEGRVLFEADEFTMKRMPPGTADFATRPQPALHELELEPQAGATNEAARSPGEAALLHNISQGIRPAEGMEVIERVLARPAVPVLYASSLDLEGLERQAAEAARPTGGESTSAKFARPHLNSEYAEPRDAIEKALVAIWEELLGVDRVGIKDSFFDLGGHSLIAVRLFSRIKKTFQVDYPISVLFEAPTIELCARMIREASGAGEPVEGGATGATAAREAPRPRYTYLVPMHTGEGGVKRPFFLVAGMFGNVLNLRHLAHLIGADRPFYGVQARGLYGDMQPHSSFVEMARDYLEEIRSVQPKGPYLIGGFSGGGITAFEMAHQLRAAGEEIGLLVMLDSILPQPPEPTRWEKARIQGMRIARGGVRYLARWARDRIEWELGKLRRRFGARVEEESDPTRFQSEAMEAAFRAALPGYALRHYPGRLVLVRPKLHVEYVLGPNRVANAQRELIFPDNCWGGYVDSIEVVEVAGDHDSMVLEPNVRALARKLRRFIEQAEAGAGGQSSGALQSADPHPAAPRTVSAAVQP